MKRLLALSVIAVLLPAGGDAGTLVRVPLPTIVGSLVRDLGADPYAVRERATKALRQIGKPALNALAEAAKSDDPEIRVRAREILADVQLGIRPDWPSEIILLIRHYDRQQPNQRHSVLQRIAGAIGPDATPFLVQRMGEGSDREANYAFRTLQRMDNERVWRQVVQLIDNPKTAHQARALAWARAQSGLAIEELERLARDQIKDITRDKAVEAALQDILQKLAAKRHQEAAAAAGKLAKAAPDDPRPRYLEAEALIPLDRDKEALALRKQAAALSPEAELPHYLAGELLTRMGRHRLAAREWERIIAIKPNDSLYDINAYLRLGAAYATSGLFESAAQYLEKALERYAKAKEAGGDEAIPAGTIESLEMELSRLRRQASSYPAPAGATIDDPLPDSEVRIDLGLTVKGGEVGDLQKALAAVAAQLHVAVEPPHIRLFDVCSASLRYDKAKKQILLLLNDETPVGPPLPFAAKGEACDAAVHAADCTYVFRLDAATGEAQQTARFEKDYVVTLKPGAKLSAYTGGVMQLNGKRHPWEKATNGITLDLLPEQFKIVLEATTPSGKRVTLRVTLPAKEPELKPPTPGPEAKPAG